MSVLPIIRMSAQGHHCQDKNLAFFKLVDDAVWKPVYKAAPDVLLYDGPGSRVVGDVLNAGKHLDGEIVAESSLTFLIVVNRRVEFDLCLGVK